ncbi:GGDEF domain-containing protein [Pararhodospirillum photometricum]|uniref:GGDEF family protein n=1 Tax=Pararhodospirillum photometricum DSM 122 TaxID=1150469 RepID=H6SRU7_PARPM|nr:GGDEF domain-containing protein [Pararhodospirillum photometricum]CCG07626.1 GGDEF family protein [Pararhodospirillum photometricum DSM 122]
MADDIQGPEHIPGPVRWTADHDAPGSSTLFHRRFSGQTWDPPPPFPNDDQDQVDSLILDLPAHLMTPRLQRALDAIMGEVDRLRAALRLAHGREAYLSSLADGDALLPILNRRATLLALGRLMREHRGRAQGIVAALFHLENHDTLRRLEGPGMANAALVHVALVLLGAGGLPALVGSLGGVTLVVARGRDPGESAPLALDALRTWAQDRRRDLVSHPWERTGTRVPLELSIQVEASGPGESLGEFCGRLEGPRPAAPPPRPSSSWGAS